MSFAYYALLIGGSFVGVVAGHSLVRAVLGGGGSHEPQYTQSPQNPVPCQSESQQLGKCIEFASQDITKCQVYMDMLLTCQQRQKY